MEEFPSSLAKGLVREELFLDKVSSKINNGFHEDF